MATVSRDMILESVFILGALSLALASTWGPGHHLEFAERVYRRRRELLPAATARLLTEHRDPFTYGNLAADVINIKAYGGHHNHCHRWTIIDDMQQQSNSSAAEEAFIFGYLSHLAADTVAHNHFVPYHLVRFARGRGLGHLYWEMMADRFVPERRWAVVSRLKDLSTLEGLDELINATVPRKVLPMGANKVIFNHVLLVSERQSWRRGVERLHPIQKVRLKRGFLRTFQEAAVARIRLALHPRGRQRLEHLDTTGKAAQSEATRLRRRLVREHRPGPKRDELCERWAGRFLQDMGLPPRPQPGRTPHW